MANCPACAALHRQPALTAPHFSLNMQDTQAKAAACTDFDSPKGIRKTRYICRMCGATFVRGAMDDDSNPIWELYAG